MIWLNLLLVAIGLALLLAAAVDGAEKMAINKAIGCTFERWLVLGVLEAVNGRKTLHLKNLRSGKIWKPVYEVGHLDYSRVTGKMSGRVVYFIYRREGNSFRKEWEVFRAEHYLKLFLEKRVYLRQWHPAAGLD